MLCKSGPHAIISQLLSLGERVASVASQVRGYLVMSAHLIPPRRASDPSPGPRRLVKAPVAVHPLPLGEGKDPIPSLSPRERGKRQRWDRCVQREMWDTLSPHAGSTRGVATSYRCYSAIRVYFNKSRQKGLDIPLSHARLGFWTPGLAEGHSRQVVALLKPRRTLKTNSFCCLQSAKQSRISSPFQAIFGTESAMRTVQEDQYSIPKCQA